MTGWDRIFYFLGIVKAVVLSKNAIQYAKCVHKYTWYKVDKHMNVKGFIDYVLVWKINDVKAMRVLSRGLSGQRIVLYKIEDETKDKRNI